METEFVKLYLYQHVGEQTIIDGHKAKDFGEFLIVEVSNDLTMDEYNALAEAFTDKEKESDKQIIIVPKAWNLEFYGVRYKTEEEADASAGGV